MKIWKVLSFLNEANAINFGHIHFDSVDEFLSHRHYEEEEYELDTWGDDARKKCENDSDFIKDEDEMTSAILSTAPQGGALECDDNYAPGDMRVPKVLGKIQRRKKKSMI